MEAARTRQIAYALTSFLLGVWAFIKVNAISGPVFEPIIAACTNPDISIDEFASKTGYHAYEPRVGLGVLNVLVCLITQFLLQLRETYPAGILVWGGVIVVSFPMAIVCVTEAGRAGSRGPIRYPVIMGLLYQILGVSVVFPMIWVPSFIFGEGKRGSPLTSFRIIMSAVMLLPSIIMTVVVFSAPTDSHLWTTCAGMLGGPILALIGLILFTDISSDLPATEQNIKNSSHAVKNVYKVLMVVCFVGWYILVAICYQSYGTSVGNIWRDIWVDANSSVAFMTIDVGVLYLGLLIFISYRSDELKAAKALLLTPILGPATALCLVMKEVEDETEFDSQQDEKKKEY